MTLYYTIYRALVYIVMYTTTQSGISYEKIICQPGAVRGQGILIVLSVVIWWRSRDSLTENFVSMIFIAILMVVLVGEELKRELNKKE